MPVVPDCSCWRIRGGENSRDRLQYTHSLDETSWRQSVFLHGRPSGRTLIPQGANVTLIFGTHPAAGN